METIEYNFSSTKKSFWKNYFKLTTNRITALALMTALNIIMAFLSKFLLAAFAFFGFLVIEVTFFTYIIMDMAVNSFYAAIMVFICTWLRALMFGSDWVGLLAMNISDLIGLIIFCTFSYLFRKIIKMTDADKKLLLVFTLASTVAIIINSIIEVFINYFITLPLYKGFFGFNVSIVMWEYLLVVLGYNMLKYFINHLIVLMMLKPLNKIIRR